MEIKCPKCRAEVSYFEHIGENPARICPLCKSEITDEELEKAKDENNTNQE
jgi:hypothetical protein